MLALLLILSGCATTGTESGNQQLPKAEGPKCDAFVQEYNRDLTQEGTPATYDNFCPDEYVLELLLANNDGVDSPGDAFKEAINGLANAAWQLYVKVTFVVISFLAWAFNLEIIDYIAHVYEEILEILTEDSEGNMSIFSQLFWLLFACAVAWAVYYWATGKKTKMWQTLINIIIIQALVALLFTNSDKNPLSLTKILQGSTDVSAAVSNQVLTGFIGKMDSGCSKDAGGGAQSSAAAIERTKDALYCVLVLTPYKTINFAKIDDANFSHPDGYSPKGDYDKVPIKMNGDKVVAARWEKLLLINTEEGRENFIASGYENEGSDIEKSSPNNPMYRLTEYGYMDRISSMLLLTFVSIIVAAAFFVVCTLVLIWQFIALGRGILGIFYLLISLWPEYGLKEAVQWFWSMLQALFMKVLYTIFLSVYIVMMLKISTESEINVDGEMVPFSDGLKLLFLIGLMIGLWQAMNELRSKVQQIPLEGGMTLAGAQETALTQGIQDKAMNMGSNLVQNAGRKAIVNPTKWAGNKALGLAKTGAKATAKATATGAARTAATLATGNPKYMTEGLKMKEKLQDLKQAAQSRKDQALENVAGKVAGLQPGLAMAGRLARSKMSKSIKENREKTIGLAEGRINTDRFSKETQMAIKAAEMKGANPLSKEALAKMKEKRPDSVAYKELSEYKKKIESGKFDIEAELHISNLKRVNKDLPMVGKDAMSRYVLSMSKEQQKLQQVMHSSARSLGKIDKKNSSADWQVSGKVTKEAAQVYRGKTRVEERVVKMKEEGKAFRMDAKQRLEVQQKVAAKKEKFERYGVNYKPAPAKGSASRMDDQQLASIQNNLAKQMQSQFSDMNRKVTQDVNRTLRDVNRNMQDVNKSVRNLDSARKQDSSQQKELNNKLNNLANKKPKDNNPPTNKRKLDGDDKSSK